jgi:phosphoribosylaminoimidazolecarboxamide formyltransferase / IMP cyclohydrolase
VFHRALISVSDKDGLETLTKGLQAVSPSCQILSTGGTSARLAELGVACQEISQFTGFPECFSGRLKTLHPKIHGGILYRRGTDEADAEKVGITPIDVVVVNLYPFQQSYMNESDDLTEMIDIGGPTLLRAAAKNCESVVVLCDPSDYQEFIQKARAGEVDIAYRRYLRAKVFAHTAAYDAAIAAALTDEPYPEQLTLSFRRKNTLRYGENPHQSAAVYQQDFWPSGLANYTLHHGKELSYNNLLDSSASLLPLGHSDRPTCCVVKHAAPCGLAQASNNREAFERAWAGDPISAFGSVVSFSKPVELPEAELLSKKFVEVIVAPGFSAEALEVLQKKPSLRLVEVHPTSQRRPQAYAHNVVLQQGLALCQQPDNLQTFAQDLVTETPQGRPSEDLVLFALNAVRCLKSNAICLARSVDGEFQTLGMGGGQPNRVQALRIAITNAREHFGEEALKDAVLASDAFFPFADSIEAAAAAGIRYIVSPSGSKNDGEVRDAAQRLGVSLVFVDHRLFRH